VDDADLSLSRTLQPRGNWRTTHLRNQHSQQNLTPSLHRTLRRLWTHLPQLLIWPSPPLRDMTTFRGRPQANLAFKCATTHPAPIGLVITASVAWKKNKSRTFFGHSYTAPTTPRELSLQQFGLHTMKALTVLLHNSFRNIVHDHLDRRTADPPLPQADPRPTQFTFSDAG